MATIYTIGFSGKNQNVFIDILNAADIKMLVDIRLWRVARFVPWASGASLSNILDTRYKYMPELAPTKELLSDYKNRKIDWPEYERIFNDLLASRQIEKLFRPADLYKVCFLCTEKSADKCHRRLVVEYLQQHFPEVEIGHL